MGRRHRSRAGRGEGVGCQRSSGARSKDDGFYELAGAQGRLAARSVLGSRVTTPPEMKPSCPFAVRIFNQLTMSAGPIIIVVLSPLYCKYSNRIRDCLA